MMRRVAAVLLLLAAFVAADGPEVTLRSLLREMTDLRRLARFPDPAYVTRQASSYDRASKGPDDPKGWFANRDAGQFLRVDGDEHVLMEARGPGAVTRIWSANPRGTLRIYLDGQKAVEASMADLLRGKVKPFVSPLAYEASRGCNLYFPFPYEKSCRITSDKGGFYYHVNYRTYPAGTKVETFRPDGGHARGMEINLALVALRDPTYAFRPRDGAGQGFVAITRQRPYRVERETPGAIHRLVLRPTRTDPESLRGTVLTIAFDDQETVRVPLGDFFGTGPGLNPYASLPLEVQKNGALVCRWTMPFKKTAVFNIEGGGKVTCDAVHEPFPWDERTMYFHATWRAQQQMATREPRDWNYLAAEGQGVYVGNLLNVANPVRRWWGEGDEKIYVDGETFPSHFGTGTEDYYGYAWCCPDPFVRPYHGQTRCDGPGNFGHSSVYRWHILDPIPFRKRFRFDMEVWHSHRATKVSYAVVNYWYARPGAKHNAPKPDPRDLTIPELPDLKIKVIAGALEGEALKVSASAGVAGPQDLSGYGGEKWSRGRHLWWRGAGPGDSLEIRFGAGKKGRRRVILHLTRAPDYGMHELSLNGRVVAASVDLFAPRVMPAAPLDLGEHDLAESNTLRVVIKGTNPKARPQNHMFGLDCIVLK